MTDTPDTPDTPDRRTVEDLAPHPDTRAPERSRPFGSVGTVLTFATVAEARAYADAAELPADILEDPRAVHLRITSGTFESALFDMLNAEDFR